MTGFFALLAFALVCAALVLDDMAYHHWGAAALDAINRPTDAAYGTGFVAVLILLAAVREWRRKPRDRLCSRM